MAQGKYQSRLHFIVELFVLLPSPGARATALFVDSSLHRVAIYYILFVSLFDGLSFVRRVSLRFGWTPRTKRNDGDRC